MNQILNASYRYTDDPRRGYSGTSPQARNGFAEIAIDGQPPYTVKVDAEGRWSWTPPADWMPGEHIVSVRMIDAAGNIGDPASSFRWSTTRRRTRRACSICTMTRAISPAASTPGA